MAPQISSLSSPEQTIKISYYHIVILIVITIEMSYYNIETCLIQKISPVSVDWRQPRIEIWTSTDFATVRNGLFSIANGASEIPIISHIWVTSSTFKQF